MAHLKADQRVVQMAQRAWMLVVDSVEQWVSYSVEVSAVLLAPTAVKSAGSKADYWAV